MTGTYIKYFITLKLEESEYSTYQVVAPWCTGSTTDCCFSDPGSLPTSTCWEVTMVRLPGDGPFWKYACQLLVGQSAHKSNSSSSPFLSMRPW